MSAISLAIPLIKEFEGYRARVYDDGLGNPTIGYGHLIRPGEHFPHPLSQHEADALLSDDLRRDYYPAVRHVAVSLYRNYRVTLSPQQGAALLSAAFNLGPGILTDPKHDLARLLARGQLPRAANALLEYVNPGTPVERGLRRRRVAERRLFLRGSSLKVRAHAALLRTRR